MSFTLRYILSELAENCTSPNWWRNRVFVPYVIGTATRLHPKYPGYDEGVHVMDEDWDNLFVLDACRADVFEDVADIDEFSDYRRVVSLGSHSSEWTRRNFDSRKFGDAVYVSANPHTVREASDAFHAIVPLWESEFDEDLETIPAETVAEEAEQAYEEYPDKRLIVHFMQPHGPLIGSDIGDPGKSEETYWQAYADNLEYVLEHALDLAGTIPGKTVLTADHGEMYMDGVLRKLGLNAHKPRLRHPSLVTVPWAVVEGERRKINAGDTDRIESDQVDERLRELGYKI